MFYAKNIFSADRQSYDLPESFSVLDIIQYYTELPIETCYKVLADVCKFYEGHLSEADVNAYIAQNRNYSQVAIIKVIENIACDNHKARPHDYIAMARARLMASEQGKDNL